MTPQPEPLSFEQFVYEFGIEEKWQAYKDEYGDAVPLLSEFKQARYEEYLRELKR
jgi:hypothetical protein